MVICIKNSRVATDICSRNGGIIRVIWSSSMQFSFVLLTVRGLIKYLQISLIYLIHIRLLLVNTSSLRPLNSKQASVQSRESATPCGSVPQQTLHILFPWRPSGGEAIRAAPYRCLEHPAEPGDTYRSIIASFPSFLGILEFNPETGSLGLVFKTFWR